MRKTLSKMKFCAKTSRRGERARAEAPEAEALAGCGRSSAPRALGLREGQGRWWGLRRGLRRRGHRGGGLGGRGLPRPGAQVRRGGHGVQGTEGTGPQTCWQGLPPTSPGPEPGPGRKVLNGAGGDPRTGPSPPASHRKPLRDWWCREPKNCSGTHVTPPGDLGVGEPCRVRPRRLLHPRNPRIAAATLSWGGGVSVPSSPPQQGEVALVLGIPRGRPTVWCLAAEF